MYAESRRRTHWISEHRFVEECRNFVVGWLCTTFFGVVLKLLGLGLQLLVGGLLELDVLFDEGNKVLVPVKNKIFKNSF